MAAKYTIEQVRAAREKALASGNQAAAEKLGKFAVSLAMENAPQEHHDATEGMSGFEKLRAGIGQGMVNVGRHVGNLVGAVSDDKIANAKERDTDLLNTGAGRVGSIIGETAITAPLMATGAGALARAGSVGAKIVGSPVMRGVVEGAAQGAVMADPGERGAGALAGGAMGSLLPAVIKGGSKLVRGVEKTPEAQRLLAEGVDLTPGQMNPRGMFNQMEESLQNVPVIGNAVKGARDNAQRDFQQSVIRRGAAPGATVPRGEIDDMLDSAYKSFEPLYDQAKGFPVKPVVMTTGADVPLGSLFKTAAATKTVRASDSTRREVAGWLNDQLTQFNGSSDDLLAIRSNIRTEIRRSATGNVTPADRAAADLMRNAEKSVTNAIESQLPKDALAALRTADSRYGQYKVIEDAVAAAKDSPNGFSPHQLSTAVKNAMEKGQYARGGGGDLRELAAAGRESFQQVTPPTGARLATLGVPAAAMMANPALAIPATLGTLGLVTTRTGRRMAGGQTGVQQALGRASDKATGKLTADQRRALAQSLRALTVVSGRQAITEE